MKYKNYNEIKKQNKKKIDKVIAGTLCSVVALGAIAGAGYYGYTEYKKLSDEKQQVEIKLDDALKENDELKLELSETKTQLANEKAKVETLTTHKATLLSCVTAIDKTVNAVESDTSMETLDKTKTDILDKYAELNSTIEGLQNTNAGNEQTILSMTATQQTLLDCITAIDNKINGTTDTTTLNNLQERKTAILTQVDDLNGQIANKQAEIERLQARVEELESQQSEYEVEFGVPDWCFNYEISEDGILWQNQYSVGHETVFLGSYAKKMFLNLTRCYQVLGFRPVSIYDSSNQLICSCNYEYANYLATNDCELTVKLFDSMDRLINVTELDDSVEYHITFDIDYTLNDYNKMTSFVLTGRFSETIPEVTTPEQPEEQTVTADNLVIDISGSTSAVYTRFVYNETTKQYTVGETVRNVEFSSYDSDNKELTFVDESSNFVIFTGVEGSWQDGKFVVTRAFDGDCELNLTSQPPEQPTENVLSVEDVVGSYSMFQPDLAASGSGTLTMWPPEVIIKFNSDLTAEYMGDVLGSFEIVDGKLFWVVDENETLEVPLVYHNGKVVAIDYSAMLGDDEYGVIYKEDGTGLFTREFTMEVDGSNQVYYVTITFDDGCYVQRQYEIDPVVRWTIVKDHVNAEHA